jgi:hypothetical protein
MASTTIIAAARLPCSQAQAVRHFTEEARPTAASRLRLRDTLDRGCQRREQRKDEQENEKRGFSSQNTLLITLLFKLGKHQQLARRAQAVQALLNKTHAAKNGGLKC